jgi:hypothetical protein
MCLKHKPVETIGVLGDLASRYALQAIGRSPGAGEASAPGRRGSARRKLWELGNHAACPVTGVCLRLPELQKLARKAGLALEGCSEYEMHIALVSECRRRTPLAEMVQRELDNRHELCVLQSLRLKSTEALARWWDQSCMGMDWAGVFWAVLTHARCTPEFEFAVLGQVHMLQHQVGMAARVDQTRLLSLLQDNQRLGDELVLTQQRLQTATQEQAQRNAMHEADCMRLRAELIRAQTAQEQAQAQLDDLKRHSPDLPLRQRLAEDNRLLLEHNQQLRRALNQAAQAAAQAPLMSVLPLPASPEEPPLDSGLAIQDEARSMHDRAVLCVGGRTRVIPVYRELVEDKGARFLHHDGGDEDKAGQLGPMLQAADLVICQVGCISHNAYWRVKEHCKRHGKPCLFVETPSRSALERALSGYNEPLRAASRQAQADPTR